MNMQEYMQVKSCTYLEYCDYLQKKYGIGLADYMTKSWNKNSRCTRTKDGLVAHHKKEDTMILLSRKEVAMLFPFEWQSKENIVYCDYLEHLFLHILICEYPSPNKVEGFEVGVGGIVDFIVPELNDVYSGWITSQQWRKNCHDKIINNKDVYLVLLKRYLDGKDKVTNLDIEKLCTSLGETYGGWDSKNNAPLYKEIRNLYKQRSSCGSKAV